MDDDDGNMDALFASFMGEVTNVKSNKMKKIEEKSGNPEEIIERLTKMRYDPKQGEGSAYLVLGVTPEASDSEITKAYRRLSVLIHPDKCKLEKASEAFQLVAKAYADTKDPNYQDKYKDIVGQAKERVKKAREKENKARAKRGEDPLDMQGKEFDDEVLRECENMMGGGSAEEVEAKNEVYEANMKRLAAMQNEARKAKKVEEQEKRQFDRTRDKRVAGWQVFMNNVDSKRFKTDTFHRVGKVGGGDHFHKREERAGAHLTDEKLKATVDLDDEKVQRSDTQVGQVGIDKSYMKAWR
eukprot:TRINITY_DN12713_c0_g1_i1.p2 TRINITY_DN12713_c0_g1~~TRINITY_DN12713_c0_g1_i1.p2  ORF type:complete len:298 (+),score=81.81 TRINITY_DN12713_c0_g1_i1:76-969(+)